MSVRTCAIATALQVYVLCLPLSHARPPEPTERLLVMLQGNSSPALRELVEDSGGLITHDLPIINAVGAQLTPEQLDKALESPLVERHITDLSVSKAPDEKTKKAGMNCDVAGQLELTIDRPGISWKLYNKTPSPIHLQALEIQWPQQLGKVTALSLASKTIEPDLYRDSGAGMLKLEFEKASAPTLAGSGNLAVSFASFAASSAPGLQQKDFSLEASFGDECSARLIPGYADNHHDFYYSSVAGADALHLNGVTGKGVTVAVLDSGLWEHEKLARDSSGADRIVARYDAITDTAGPEVFDASGHGTHMTSVIAHSGEVTRNGVPQGYFKGIAPDVSLVAVKAFDHEGQGDFLDIVRAIQWIVEQRETLGIQVINLSFAARPRWHYWEDPINQAVMRAWASGITVVAAAGNEGPEPMTIGSPGNLPYIITVGAVTDSWSLETRDDDYIPDFSSRGPTPSAHIKPDIVAPGGHITGITRPGSTLTTSYPEYILRTGEFVMTGSSQASALVSGIVALLLQLEPDLGPDEVKCRLLSSAEPAINRDGLLAYSPFVQGHGLVSARRAVTLGETGCANQDIDIQQEISNREHFEGPAIIADDGNPSLPGLEHMVADQPSATGMSKTRKWGVKAHIERSDSGISPSATAGKSPFDWQQVYLEEKAKIEALAREPLE